MTLNWLFCQTSYNKVVNGTPTTLHSVAARYHWR